MKKSEEQKAIESIIYNQLERLDKVIIKIDKGILELFVANIENKAIENNLTIKINLETLAKRAAAKTWKKEKDWLKKSRFLDGDSSMGLDYAFHDDKKISKIVFRSYISNKRRYIEKSTIRKI